MAPDKDSPSGQASRSVKHVVKLVIMQGHYHTQDTPM